MLQYTRPDTPPAPKKIEKAKEIQKEIEKIPQITSIEPKVEEDISEQNNPLLMSEMRAGEDKSPDVTQVKK